MLYLGVNIKECRIKKGFTQEQLSFELGVSSQTISRWENGLTYPDIVMLPIIAEYFGITIDTLMGYVRECQTQEREKFYKEMHGVERSEAIQRHREMLHTYPNDVYIQFSLANLLYAVFKKNDDKDTENEIYLLCNRIMQSDKPAMQCGAIRLLALLYAKNGDIESAMKYVNELPSIHCGRETMAEQILKNISFKEAVKNIVHS